MDFISLEGKYQQNNMRTLRIIIILRINNTEFKCGNSIFLCKSLHFSQNF